MLTAGEAWRGGPVSEAAAPPGRRTEPGQSPPPRDRRPLNSAGPSPTYKPDAQMTCTVRKALEFRLVGESEQVSHLAGKRASLGGRKAFEGGEGQRVRQNTPPLHTEVLIHSIIALWTSSSPLSPFPT